MYLEWAPSNALKPVSKASTDNENDVEESGLREATDAENKTDSDDRQPAVVKPGCTLFVKNLNFDTNEETLKNVCLFFFLLFVYVILE